MVNRSQSCRSTEAGDGSLTHQQFPTSVLGDVRDFLKGNPEFLMAIVRRSSSSAVFCGGGGGSDTGSAVGGSGTDGGDSVLGSIVSEMSTRGIDMRGGGEDG